MALPTITAVNLTASPISLDTLALVVPASGNLTLTDTARAYEIFTSPHLSDAVSADQISLQLNGQSLTKEQSQAVLGLITPDFFDSCATVYDPTGGQTFTNVATTLALTTSDNALPSDVSLAGDTLTTSRQGFGLFMYTSTLRGTSGSRSQATSWLEKNGAIVGSTLSTHYLRNSNSGTSGSSMVYISHAPGDQFRLRGQRVAGGTTVATVANGTQLTYLRMR